MLQSFCTTTRCINQGNSIPSELGRLGQHSSLIHGINCSLSVFRGSVMYIRQMLQLQMAFLDTPATWLDTLYQNIHLTSTPPSIGLVPSPKSEEFMISRVRNNVLWGPIQGMFPSCLPEMLHGLRGRSLELKTATAGCSRLLPVPSLPRDHARNKAQTLLLRLPRALTLTLREKWSQNIFLFSAVGLTSSQSTARNHQAISDDRIQHIVVASALRSRKIQMFQQTDFLVTLKRLTVRRGLDLYESAIIQ